MPKAKKAKRPPSAYNLFVKDNLSSIKKDNDGITQGEAMKLCSQKWKELKDTPEVEAYVERSKKAKEEMAQEALRERSTGNLSGAVARLEEAIRGMRSSPKKTELLQKFEEVRTFMP